MSPFAPRVMSETPPPPCTPCLLVAFPLERTVSRTKALTNRGPLLGKGCFCNDIMAPGVLCFHGMSQSLVVAGVTEDDECQGEASLHEW